MSTRSLERPRYRSRQREEETAHWHHNEGCRRNAKGTILWASVSGWFSHQRRRQMTWLPCFLHSFDFLSGSWQYPRIYSKWFRLSGKEVGQGEDVVVSVAWWAHHSCCCSSARGVASSCEKDDVSTRVMLLERLALEVLAYRVLYVVIASAISIKSQIN